MEEARLSARRSFGVLDIETAPDDGAVALARSRPARAQTSVALHRVRSAAWLNAIEHDDGSWSVTGIQSVGGDDEENFDHANIERQVLIEVDAFIVDLAAAGGSIITYNGVRHDFPTLKRRAARHLMFELRGIMTAERMPHVDLMLAGTRPQGASWFTLKDAAAGLGIPVADQLPSRGLGSAVRSLVKGETDVTASFLLMLYELALTRGDARPVLEGWRALGDYIRNLGPHGEHLAQFRRHHLGMR